ncbi:MAG: AAA family ATPase [Syntrophobacteraceae bacterium]
MQNVNPKTCRSSLDKKVSLFSNAAAVTPIGEPTLREILADIARGKYKGPIERLRALKAAGDAAGYEDGKKKLPAFSLSALLITRAKDVPLPEKLKAHTHMIQVDIDEAPACGFEALEKRLREDPYVLACFRSPGGGLKVCVRIDGTRHADSFLSVERYFREKYDVQIDSSVKDVGRLCFVSYDPDLYINEAALILPITSNGTKPATDSAPKQSCSLPTDPGRKLTYGERALDTARKMIERAADGEKYPTLLKAGKLLGGYVAGGMLTCGDAESLLRSAIDSKANVRSLETAYKAIVTSLDHGQQNPIQFEELERQRIEYLEANGFCGAGRTTDSNGEGPQPEWEAGYTEQPTGKGDTPGQRQSEDKDLVTLISYRELLSMEFTDRPLIEGLLGEKESLIIVGQSGIAKSICALNIALRAGVSGDQDSPIHLFDQFGISRQCNSLFIQSENTAKATKKRLKMILERAPWLEEGVDHLFSAYIRNDVRLSGPLTEQKFQDGILSLLDKAHADLLILDPLISYHDADENDNASMRRTLDCLTVICDKADVACIVVHHAGKGGTDNQVFAGRGASAIGDWAANILVLNPGPELEMEDGSRRFVIEVSHRKSRNYEPVGKFFLERVNGTLLIPIHSCQLDPKRTARIQTVVLVLKGLDGYVDHKEVLVATVMKYANIARGTAQTAIREALEENKIFIVPINRKQSGYRLPDVQPNLEVNDD